MSTNFKGVRPETDLALLLLRVSQGALSGRGDDPVARHCRRMALLEERAVGLSWQQGPLSVRAIGRFLVPEPLPKRLLYVEPLRRRMRVRFGGIWIADSEHALLLFEPGRYPVAYFPESDISPGALQHTDHT